MIPFYLSSAPHGATPPTPLTINKNCQRCDLHKQADPRRVCMVDGALRLNVERPGGILVVTDYPTETDEQTGRIFGSQAGEELRELFRRYASRDVWFGYALKCSPVAGVDEYAQVSVCRGYLAEEIRRYQPARIVALGPLALYALTGERVSGGAGVVPGYAQRRGVFYLTDKTPVLGLFHPKHAYKNRFAKAAFLADVEWACTDALEESGYLEGGFEAVSSGAIAGQVLALAKQEGHVSVALQSAGFLCDASFTVLAVAVCVKTGGGYRAFVWSQEALQDAERLSGLRAIVEDNHLRKSAQEAKQVISGLRVGLRMELRNLWADPGLWQRLLDTNASILPKELACLVGLSGLYQEQEQSIAALQRRLVGSDKKNIIARCPPGAEDGIARGNRAEQYLIAAVPEGVLLRSVARTVVSTARLTALLYPKLHEPENSDLWENAWGAILRELSSSLSRVEEWGFLIDRGAVTQFASFLQVKITELENRLRTYGLTEPKSPQQVQRYLYETLALPEVRTRGGQLVTDEAAIEPHIAQHPQLWDLLEWRRLQKLHGTYAMSLLRCIRSDGRVHSSFGIAEAVTLRLVSSDPNLQNQPKASKSDEAKLARGCFIAPPGWFLVEGDYNQQEIRIGANQAADDVMLSVFERGEDFYRETARMVAPILWGRELKTFTSEEQTAKRDEVKWVTLGLLYGMGAGTLAGDLGISKGQAERVVAAILGRYKGLKAWIDQSYRFAMTHGYCTTWWDGRPLHRRMLWDIASQDHGLAGSAERSAYNTRLQGTGAAFIMATINSLVRWILFDGVPARVNSSVHDSVILEVREDALPEVVAKVREVMQGFNNGRCPLVVEVKVGKHLGDMRPYTGEL